MGFAFIVQDISGRMDATYGFLDAEPRAAALIGELEVLKACIIRSWYPAPPKARSFE